MKNRKPIFQPLRSMTAIGLRLGCFALAVWLIGVALITHSTATEIYDQMQIKTREFATFYAQSLFNSTEEKASLPGYPEYCRINTMENTSLYFLMYPNSLLASQLPDIITADDNPYMPYDLAVSYKDSSGNIIDTTGDYLTFPYMTSQLWQTAQSRQELSGYTWIDLEQLNDAYYTREISSLSTFNDFFSVFRYKAGRFTGYFENNRFVPVTVDYSTQDNDAIMVHDRAGNVRWFNIYQAPAPTGKELVTIYAVTDFGPRATFEGATDMGPVTIRDTQYAQLEDVLPRYASKDSLMDAVVFAGDTYTDIAGEEIHVRVALRAKPLPYTLQKLAGFYILSFGIMALAVWLILWKINRHLARPTAQVAYCSTGEPKPLPEHIKKSKWLEARTLQENYEIMVDTHHRTQTELRQLQVALDYAQNAETKRREMVSNITHELKTPLAIIHSYAEGLKEGIAADKQAQYLNVILEESERMDAMVLEMLDLSRLEAGKVRLSSDRFSLLGLTRSIFDRLAPVAAEKDLQIQYHIVEEFDITADESRIGQVITNFATNAIKYTPAGGNIWIKVYRFREQTILCIENQCEPLPQETLNRVWDSFYRTESSRTSKGTGLGLTIAKAIIELHGGTVGVQNTSSGVEFRFTLP